MARKTSIELLRVLLLVMVVSIHVSGPYLSAHFISGVMNWQVANLLDGGSRVAVGCFVLITGYFLSSGKAPALSRASPQRRVGRVLTPLCFYFPLYVGLYWGYEGGSLFKPLVSAAYDLLRNDGLFYHMWYTQVIIAVYLLSPYLNTLVETLNREQLRNLVVTLLVLTSVLPSLVYVTGIGFHDVSLLNSRLLLFVMLYMTGAFVRLHVHVEAARPATLAAAFALIEALIVGLTFIYNSRYSPLIFFARLRGVTLTYPFGGISGAFYDFNSILVVAGSVLLFVLFLRLNLDTNQRLGSQINRIGGWTYGAYVGHVFWIQLITRFVDPATYADGPFYPLVAVSVIAAVSVCALCTEGLRQTVAGLAVRHTR